MSNNIICIDANFLVRLVSSHPSETIYLQLWTQWKNNNYQIFAPTLCYYEVSNALYRMNKANLLSTENANLALEYALNLDIILYGNIGLHIQASKLAKQLNLSAAYDAHYLALAQLLESDFYTADKKLYNSVKDVFSWVHLVE
ncbi:MAG TPA: type II toxin-antitoxin system VapC family toxin [Allocoleopsis sp.]